MNFSTARLRILTLGLFLLLPLGNSRSQLAPVSDPMADMQSMLNANDDLLKRQDATLKDLTDITTMANEVRIYSRRG